MMPDERIVGFVGTCRIGPQKAGVTLGPVDVIKLPGLHALELLRAARDACDLTGAEVHRIWGGPFVPQRLVR